MKRILAKAMPGLWIPIALSIYSVTLPCFAATETVLDTFSVASYSNQDGSQEWSGDWQEVNDSGGAASGNVFIYQAALHLEGGGFLSFGTASIFRSVDLSQASSAQLNFDYTDYTSGGFFGSATIDVYVSDDGGVTWNNLGSVSTGSASGNRSFDISSYLSADTTIGFYASWGGLWSAFEVAIDDIEVAYEIPGAAAIDHYEIVHDGAALTCSPETITVRACVDANCDTLVSDDVDIDLSPPGWIGGASQTLSGGSGVFRLRHTTPGVITLSVSSSDPVAGSAPQCMDGSGVASCELTFHEAGFLFDVADLTACSLEQNIRIAAVRADATAEQCIGDDSFANTTRNVNFWSGYQDPATGSRAVYVNGTAVSGASPGTAVQLSFDAQAESRLDVSYADVGRVGLSTRFEGSGDESGLVMIGSDSFVAAPHHLRVEATTDGTTPLNNATFAGDPRWPAGEDFSVNVTGVCADDSVTPNFAATTDLRAIAADPAPGAFSGGSLAATDYSGGTATGTAAYSEVGTVTLQAEATDYLGSGIDVAGTTVVGRFTPYRFDVSLNSPQFAPACIAGGFTYLGQPFTYATPPVITVTARNKSGGTTANYTQEWWKITGTTLTGMVYNAESGTLDLSAIPAGDPVISDLGGGIGLLTFGDGGGIHFVRNAVPETLFDAEISLAIDVLDADGIAATANPVTFGAATAGNGIPFVGGGKAMHWGRLALYNAYGSERVPLAMPVRTESFDGTAFITHTPDDCTGTALNQISLTNDSGTVTADNPIAVGSGSSSASLSNPVVAGDAGLQFSAPGSEGYIHVQVDLSSLPWLRYDWNGDAVQDDPAARATFGIYKGRPSLIYFRETYR